MRDYFLYSTTKLIAVETGGNLILYQCKLSGITYKVIIVDRLSYSIRSIRWDRYNILYTVVAVHVV